MHSEQCPNCGAENYVMILEAIDYTEFECLECHEVWIVDEEE